MLKGINKLTKALYATKCTKLSFHDLLFWENLFTLSHVKPANQIGACYFVSKHGVTLQYN